MNEKFEWIGFIIKILSVIIPVTIATIYAIKDFKRESDNKLKLIGYFVIVLLIISLILGICDYFNSLKAERNNEIEIQRALEKRDSINQAKNDKASKLLYESFAKYGLKYDIAKQEIRNLVRDSARINYISAEKPYFYIHNITKLNSNAEILKLRITFTSKATSYNIDTYLDFIEYDSISNKLRLIQRDFQTLAKGTEVTEKEASSIDIPFKNVPKNVPAIFIRLKGNYETSDGTKIKVDKIYSYHLRKGFTEPSAWLLEMVQKFIKNEKL